MAAAPCALRISWTDQVRGVCVGGFICILYDFRFRARCPPRIHISGSSPSREGSKTRAPTPPKKKPSQNAGGRVPGGLRRPLRAQALGADRAKPARAHEQVVQPPVRCGVVCCAVWCAARVLCACARPFDARRRRPPARSSCFPPVGGWGRDAMSHALFTCVRAHTTRPPPQKK